MGGDLYALAVDGAGFADRGSIRVAHGVSTRSQLREAQRQWDDTLPGWRSGRVQETHLGRRCLYVGSKAAPTARPIRNRIFISPDLIESPLGGGQPARRLTSPRKILALFPSRLRKNPRVPDRTQAGSRRRRGFFRNLLGVQRRSALSLRGQRSGWATAMITTNGTCNICGRTGWTLMYRGQRCLSCIRAGNPDARLSVAPPDLALRAAKYPSPAS
jgi:hypothetical protein